MLVAINNGDVRYADCIYPTVILNGTSADDIWEGLLKSQGSSPWRMAESARHFILGLTSDAATSNGALVANLVSNKPDNAMVVHQLCSAHQVHLSACPLWVGVGILSDMFCTTNVLQTAPQSGHVWLDLQKAAGLIVDKHFQVSYEKSNPDAERFAKLVVGKTLLASEVDSADEDSGFAESQAKRLLAILNGDWTSRVAIVHHCCIGCPAGCTSLQDSKARAKAAIQEIIFGKRPTAPALSRWTACITTGRFYMLANCCHGILSRSFQMVFPSNPSAAKSTSAAGHTGSDSGVVAISEEELLTLPSSEKALYERKQRHRASKAFAWLGSLSMTLEVTVAVFVTTPMDRLLHHIFMSHALRLHKCSDMSLLPLVNLAGPRSIAKQSVDEFCALLQDETVLRFVAKQLRCPDYHDDDAQLSLLQHSILLSCSEVHERLVLPYTTRWPWSLALLLDHTVDHAQRRVVAEEFMEASDCCLDVAVSRCIKRIACTTDGLLNSSDLLRLVFSNKVCNIACELNFARAGSQHRSQAGKTAVSATTAAKHVLAEITSKQNDVLKQAKRMNSASHSKPHPSYLMPLSGEGRVDHHQHMMEDQDQDTPYQRSNGWTLFLKEEFRCSIGIGETRASVWNRAKHRWNSDARLRAEWGARARVTNRCNKEKRHEEERQRERLSVLPPEQSQSLVVRPLESGAIQTNWDFLPVAQPIPQEIAGTGDFGFGNEQYWLAPEVLDRTICSSTEVFYAAVAEWKQRFSEPCKRGALPNAAPLCPQCDGVCQMKFRDAKAAAYLEHLKNVVRMCRLPSTATQAMQGQQKKARVTLGGEHRQALLLCCEPSSEKVHGWIIGKIMLKPLGLTLISLDLESDTSRPMVVTGKIRLRLAHLSESLLTPDFLSMENLAIWASTVAEPLKWQLVDKYKCLSMMEVEFDLSMGTWLTVREWARELQQKQTLAKGSGQEAGDDGAAHLSELLSALKPPRPPRVRQQQSKPRQNGVRKRAQPQDGIDALADELKLNALVPDNADVESGHPNADHERDDSDNDFGQPHAELPAIQEEWEASTEKPVTESAPSSKATPDASAPASSSSSAQAQTNLVELTRDERGVVYKGKMPIGRVSETNPDTTKHSISIACRLHKACSTMRRMKAVPVDVEARALDWLRYGLTVNTKEEHMKVFDRLVMGRPGH